MQGLLDAIDKEQASRDIFKLSCFIQYASRLKNEILLAQNSSHLPNIVPQFLPISVVNFLASSCALSEKEVEECWTVVKELVWSTYILDDKAVSTAFRDHGTDKGFGLFLPSLSPKIPIRKTGKCLFCTNKPLGSQWM